MSVIYNKNRVIVPYALSGSQVDFINWTQIPTNKKLITGNITTDATLQLEGTIPAGENITIIAKNTSTATVTVSLTSFAYRNVDTISVDANMQVEINIASDGVSLFARGINYEN